MVTNFYGIFKCCWLKNTFKHMVWYMPAIWFGAMNVANAGTEGEMLPRSLDEAFNSGGVYILPHDIVINSKIVVSSNNGIEIQLNDYNISAALDDAANNLFLVENDGVLILSGKEPAGEEKTADKNSVTAGNNADILNVNGGLVKLSNLTLKNSKTAAIIADSAVFQAINARFANMNNGAVKNAGNASFSGKNDFVDNSVATGNGGALNLEKESETKFSDYSLFDNNKAADGNGGAIYGDGSLYFGDQNKLISAVFTNNTATDGGAVFVDENGKFVGYGEFIFGQNAGANGNVATNYGGAIYNKGQMSFVGFNGKETKSIMFAANQATNGGAIYNTGALNLNGQLSFIDNSALYNGKDDTKGFGGAIYNTGTLDIYGTDVKFGNNEAQKAGGNTAQKAGGAIYNNGGVVNISGSGILFDNNKVLETDKVDFVNWKNDAKKGFGGAIANMEGSRLNISGNVTFSNNGKDSKIAGGGAVYNRGYMTISGTRITKDGRDTTDSYKNADASIVFENNVASKGIGGAIEAKGSHSGTNTVALSVIRGVNFIGNSSNADKQGDSRAGAIRANNDSITILDNVVFKGNSSKAAGGAISTANNLKDSALGTFISISNAYFDGNSVSMVGADGGAIRTGGALSMTNVQFENNENKNDLDGAALSFDGTSLLLVADNGNVLFKGNIAKKGLTGQQSSSGIHIDGKDAKKIMFNAGNGGEVIFFDKIVNAGTGAGANLTLELNKSNVLNATSTQLEQIYAKFFDAGGAYIGTNSRDEMQETILGANSVYWLSKEEAAAAGKLKLQKWNYLHEVEGIKTAPTDGKIIFNTQISDTSLNLHNGELLLADEITDEIRNKPYIKGNSNLNLYGGKLDVSNNNIESKDQLAFNKINVEGEAELNLDIDILHNQIDYLGQHGITGTDKGKLVISEIGILNEATNWSLGDGSELLKFTGSNVVKTELSKMTQVIVTSNAGYYFTLGKVDGSSQNNAVKLYKVLSGGGLGVALDSGSEFGISMKQSGGVETVNWAEKYDIYDPKTGKTYSDMVGTNVQKGAVFTLKGEKESVVKAGDDANNKVGIVAGTKKFGADGKVYTLAMNEAANDIKNRETSVGRNTWYTYNKNETTGIREEGAEVADMSGTKGQNLNISNIKFEGFDTAITNYETGVINLENVGFSNNTLDIYNLGTLNLKGENTFTNGIGGKDSLGVMSIINGKTISNSEINQQNVIINDIASLTVNSDHLKSVTTNNGELNLGKGTLAYKVTGAGKTYISAGTEENKNKFSLADNVTIKQNSFSVLKNADAENVKGGKIIADTIKIAESGALSTKVGEHLQGNIDNHGTLTLFGSGDKSVTELFSNALVDSYGEKTGKLVIDESANIKATEKINQNTMVNNGTFYADINKLAIEDKNSGITNDGVLYLNGSATNEVAAQNNLITTVRGNGVLYLSNNVVNTQNITQKKIHLIDNANVEAENDSTLKAKIKLDEGTKLAINAENLISNKPADEIDGNWIDVENEGSLNLSGNLLNVVIGKATDKENGGLVNINSSISFGENGEIRNNTVNIKNDGVGLTANADKITNGVIYVNNNSLTLTGGTNTNIIRKDFTPKAETTLGGTTYIGNSLNAANVINKEKIETDLFISNRANLTSELADLSGKISMGNLGTLTLVKDAVLAENRKIYGKGNVIIGNNSLIMKNNSSIEGMLSSDRGTLNLAYDKASVTDAVSIGALGGNLNLAIKMALSDLTENKGMASSLKINNGDALANKNSKIILSNINLTKGFLETTPDGTSYSKFVTVADGDFDNITFGFTDGNVMKSTDGKYIYNFTWNNEVDGKGKLDVKGIKIGGASGLPMFVKGSDYFGDVVIYQMSDSLVYSSLDGNAIGTTYRTEGNSKNLTLNMGNNNLVAEAKDDENNNVLDGITVAGGYTFNVNASNTEADKGIISGFKTAFEVMTGGILNINNVKFENNTDDVKNEGTVNLAENIVLNAISGVDGILNILDSADVTIGSIKQKLLVNNGTLTISADNLQTTEAVENNNKLNLTGGKLGVGINGLGTTDFSNNNALNDNIVVSQAKIINSGILDATKGKLISDDIISTGTLKLKGDITASQVISGGKNNDGGLLKLGTLELSDATIFGDVVQDKIILGGTVTNNKNMIFNELKNNGIFSTLADGISGDLTNDVNAELNLNGGTLNANVSGGKTNINGDVVLASSSNIAASAVNVAENKSLTIAAGSLWNNAISGNGTTIFGADFNGNNNAVIETLLTNNGVLTSNTANIKGNVNNNNKLTLNSNNDVFDNTITGNGNLTLNGVMAANKTISQKSITNNGSLTANAEIIGAVQNNGTLNSAAENIKTSVTNKADAELNLNGGTLNANVSGGKTNINGDVVLASSSNIASSAVNVAENKSLTIAAGSLWNNKISGNGTTIFGADFDGSNNAVIETLLTNNGILTTDTDKIKGNVTNNNKLTLNSNNDVFDNTITGNGDLILNGAMTANKTISQKSITNNGTLTSSAENIKTSVTNKAELNLSGGTLNAAVSGGKTNITGDVVLASSSKIAASAVNVAENKSLTIAAGSLWNNKISGNGTTIFGADFDGSNNAVIETLLTNNGVLTSNTANIKGNVNNNKKLTLNSNNDVFDNTITGNGDLTLNGVMTANKTISQKSITNNGTLNSSIDNLNGELINTGIFNVAGANVVLNKNIAGEGTTVLENGAILKFGDSGKIEGVLKTNGATVDLQDTANKYTDVKIGSISGDLKLKIDADLSNASSDALELTSSNLSNGNVILSSINVQKDGDKSVTFLKGNIGGITSSLDTASTISTITNDYTYTFGISGNNKLDVLSAVLNTKPNTLKDFVTGNLAISANTYSMTKDISITSAENDNFGTTAGANKELNLNLNGHNLYGTLNGVKKDGIAVGNGYTLNINGTDGTSRGNISGFDNALKVENGGILNIENTVLNNDTDINNQGTLYANNINVNKVATASNAVIKNSNITDLKNRGTAALKGTNALTNITEAGNLIVNDGKTTVLGKLEQNSVTVANNAVLEAVLDKFVVSSNTINNGVLNLFGGGAINKDITGNGSLNLGGIVDNNAAITQKDLTLASGKFINSGTISIIDIMNINGDMTNNGSVSAKDLIVSGNFANKANAAINGVLTLKENTAATAENNGIITGGVIVENNRILANNNLVSGKVNVGNNGKILGNSGVMNITETSENNGEINQHKFTISNTGGFVNKGVLTSAVLENNNNLINSNKITAAMLKNNGNIDNTNGTIEGVITNENIINGGKIIANDGSVNNKTINADLTSKGKFTNKGNIAGTVTSTGLFSNTDVAKVTGNILSSGDIDNSGIINGDVTSGGSFKNAGIIKGNVTNNGDLTSAIENIMGTVINNGTYKTSGGIMNYDINGAGNTEINGNVVMGAGMFGANQSVDITAGSLLDIGAKTVNLNNLKLNGTLGLEITSIANKSSEYVGGKLLVNNADLSGGKIQFTVNQGLLNKKEQTGDLSIIGLKSGSSGSIVGDLTKVFEKNNRYEIIQGTKNGTVIIKNIASSSDVASLVGNRNNKNTAAAWENATLTSGTAAANIQKALDSMSQHNAQGYRRALNELAPSDSQMNLETVRLVQNIIGRETGKRFEKGKGVCSLYKPASMWVKGIGASHYMDNRAAAQGFNADTAGYVMGYDGNVDCDTSVGLGYAYTNTKGNTNSRKSSISAQNVFVYGKYQTKLTYIRGAFMYGLADYDDKTSVAGYGISSKYNMHSVGAETALGHEYQNGLNPEAGLRYTNLMPNDYTDSIGQKVENENITAISAFAKLKYKAEVKTDNQILFKPAIYIGANYDLNNSSHKINVAVANSRYKISSEPMSRFGFNGGLELAVSHDNVDLILGYDLNLHTKYNAHSGQIQFRYNF